MSLDVEWNNGTYTLLPFALNAATEDSDWDNLLHSDEKWVRFMSTCPLIESDHPQIRHFSDHDPNLLEHIQDALSEGKAYLIFRAINLVKPHDEKRLVDFLSKLYTIEDMGSILDLQLPYGGLPRYIGYNWEEGNFPMTLDKCKDYWDILVIQLGPGDVLAITLLVIDHLIMAIPLDERVLYKWPLIALCLQAIVLDEYKAEVTVRHICKFWDFSIITWQSNNVTRVATASIYTLTRLDLTVIQNIRMHCAQLMFAIANRSFLSLNGPSILRFGTSNIISLCITFYMHRRPSIASQHTATVVASLVFYHYICFKM
ncbi:hypothetical protein OBBRIDRAFT_808593 [Obba rivulosa]|uniref:Uncharacterized protein n=1 Tax=Obba rivulosa TaxID=1052685 RepID=A0A8E2DER3_9APHY|nr:hypothetical protein OBBRIDRAFT_808593 [Obba rivulosa]